jgi:hypothetical protein
MERLAAALKFLNDLGRVDLSALLQHSTVNIEVHQVGMDDFQTRATITSHPSFTEALKGLSDTVCD